MSAPTASQAARTGAVVVVEAERGVLRVTGGDRVSWLNGVVTCDVAAVSREQAAFGLLLGKVGKIHTDFYVLADADALLVACAPGTVDGARAELERMLVMEDAELGRPGEPLACLSLHGPRSVELAGTLSAAVAAKLDRTGLGGAVVLVAEGAEHAAVAELAAAGAVLAGADDWQALRIERRLGAFGVDYGPADNPHEAALDRVAIAWNKGCYLGQEVVFMQDARGKLKRRLALLACEGSVPERGAAVLAPDGESVGEVTSAAWSSAAGAPVALARVKAPHFEPGARLVVGGAAAVVRAEPF